ncbi:hypothetical protein QUF76_10355 [Desulfobacterales bacterium HSG16]|nr:hypothetical protein [Desulfobacterales bacterium HSG16]
MTEFFFTRDIATFKPLTFNQKERSVQVIAVSEQPVRVWDNERGGFIDEVLMVNRFVLPPSKQVPLLDSHNRSTVSGVLGSARGFVPNGNTLECRVCFSGTIAGAETALKVEEGHLTDFSVGYTPMESTWIPDGESRDICERTFSGPLKVTTKWYLRELSITPIGADQMAKARSLNDESVPQHAAQNHVYSNPSIQAETEQIVQDQVQAAQPQQQTLVQAAQPQEPQVQATQPQQQTLVQAAQPQEAQVQAAQPQQQTLAQAAQPQEPQIQAEQTQSSAQVQQDAAITPSSQDSQAETETAVRSEVPDQPPQEQPQVEHEQQHMQDNNTVQQDIPQSDDMGEEQQERAERADVQSECGVSDGTAEEGQSTVRLEPPPPPPPPPPENDKQDDDKQDDDKQDDDKQENGNGWPTLGLDDIILIALILILACMYFFG